LKRGLDSSPNQQSEGPLVALNSGCMIRMSDLGVQVSAVSKKANQHFRHHPKPEQVANCHMDALTRTEFYGSFPTGLEPKTKLGDSSLSIGA
jgi:hypothetical protein